jgi:hypothetical protein
VELCEAKVWDAKPCRLVNDYHVSNERSAVEMSVFIGRHSVSYELVYIHDIFMTQTLLVDKFYE